MQPRCSSFGFLPSRALSSHEILRTHEAPPPFSSRGGLTTKTLHFLNRQRCMESIEEPEKSVQILKEMPDVNQKTLGYVIQFLQQYILPEKSITKMDEDNLAMTLAPVLFGHNESIGMRRFPFWLSPAQMSDSFTAGSWGHGRVTEADPTPKGICRKST